MERLLSVERFFISLGGGQDGEGNCLPLLYGVGEFDAEAFRPLRAPKGAGAMARSATCGEAVRDIG